MGDGGADERTTNGNATPGSSADISSTPFWLNHMLEG